MGQFKQGAYIAYITYKSRCLNAGHKVYAKLYANLPRAFLALMSYDFMLLQQNAMCMVWPYAVQLYLLRIPGGDGDDGDDGDDATQPRNR
jgi:hypothetical protein